jgi:hypothetical protein
MWGIVLLSFYFSGSAFTKYAGDPAIAVSVRHLTEPTAAGIRQPRSSCMIWRIKAVKAIEIGCRYSKATGVDGSIACTRLTWFAGDRNSWCGHSNLLGIFEALWV